MRHLNYHHLLYFHTVAEEGSVAAAAEALHITPQTISGQIKLLEGVVGQALFVKSGRGLKISDAGRAVKVYTDDIFSVGLNLAAQLSNDQIGATAELRIGIADSIPKLVACQLTAPIVEQTNTVKLVCSEGRLDTLLADLAVHRLDLIISDMPIPSGYGVKAYNHTLGKTQVGFYSSGKNTAQLRKQFPASLNTVPLLMPTKSSPLRRQLDAWFEERDIEPNIVAEFEDSALMKTFGDLGHGVFPSPEIIGADIRQRYQAKSIGLASGVHEEYIMISPQRRLRQDTVKKLLDHGRALLDH